MKVGRVNFDAEYFRLLYLIQQMVRKTRNFSEDLKTSQNYLKRKEFNIGRKNTPRTVLTQFLVPKLLRKRFKNIYSKFKKRQNYLFSKKLFLDAD